VKEKEKITGEEKKRRKEKKKKKIPTQAQKPRKKSRFELN